MYVRLSVCSQVGVDDRKGQPTTVFTAATGQQLSHDVALSSAGAMTTRDSKVLKVDVRVTAPELV